jgi:hypothetical protein
MISNVNSFRTATIPVTGAVLKRIQRLRARVAAFFKLRRELAAAETPAAAVGDGFSSSSSFSEAVVPHGASSLAVKKASNKAKNRKSTKRSTNTQKKKPKKKNTAVVAPGHENDNLSIEQQIVVANALATWLSQPEKDGVQHAINEERKRRMSSNLSTLHHPPPHGRHRRCSCLPFVLIMHVSKRCSLLCSLQGEVWCGPTRHQRVIVVVVVIVVAVGVQRVDHAFVCQGAFSYLVRPTWFEQCLNALDS